jgi:5-methylthioadenosine/S-adenosylhomocysteine deaminase
VLPFEGAPIADGAVLTGPDGRLEAIGPARNVPAPPDVQQVEFGPASALLPGLINTHTHLELTGLDAEVPDNDFPSWIRRIIAVKAGRSAADFRAAAEQGIRACWAQGVTTVADTGDSGAVLAALAELQGSGICYHEVFGPHPDAAESQFTAWTARMEDLARLATPRVRLGASPHAPYSVSGPLYRMVAAWAWERDLPVAVHLAESEAESLLLQGAGGFAAAWQGRGIPLLESAGRSPVAWLDYHAVLGPRTLCIHMVRATPDDLGLIVARRSAIAHCPRSNRRHGHGDAPLRQILDHGIPVGVGTDSVASVSPLDLFAETRLARELGGLSAEEALGLVTVSAARALGLAQEIGTLAPGKWADLVALDLGGPVDATKLADTVLARGDGAVLATVVGGRTVFEAVGR